MFGRRMACGGMAAVLLGLAGCSGPGPNTAPRVTHSLGYPRGVSLQPAQGAERVGWENAHQLAVVTYGSSGCPLLPVSVGAAGNLVVIIVGATVSADSPCLADNAASTSLVPVPKTIDVSQPVVVVIHIAPGEPAVYPSLGANEHTMVTLPPFGSP